MEGFILTVFKDTGLARACLTSLRNHYPENPVVIISDGDNDSAWQGVAENFRAELVYGKHMLNIASGGEYTRRILKHAWAMEADVVFRLCTSARFHKKLKDLPQRGVFGSLQWCGDLKSIQGGCTGIVRSSIPHLLEDDALYEKLKNPETWVRCPTLSQRASAGRTSWDWTLGWLCKEKNVLLSSHLEIGSYWPALPKPMPDWFAVTSPHHDVLMPPIVKHSAKQPKFL